MGWKRRKKRLTRSEKFRRWYRRRMPAIVIALALTAFAIVGGILLYDHFPPPAVSMTEEAAPSE
ncbi:hypothetical protein [Rhizorhabdus sp.]|uniref:hypothetical protein n=1 Tax=Rhizorhabdus sp. TaxID=1968843 RepID=UPI0019A0D302|nr:hypothetical protein [Rhizorhabdus sp.]MBD3760698.1 hypothetical protein [Rhizorhabdus sp.]